MKQLILPNGVEVEYYDSIDEMPVIRYHKFNEQLMYASSLGGDMNDIEEHLRKVIEMINRDDKPSATQQIVNMSEGFRNIVSNINPRSKAFAVLVFKANGVEQNDLSDVGLNKLVGTLSRRGLSWGMVKFAIDYVKKKWRKKSKSSFLIQ